MTTPDPFGAPSSPPTPGLSGAGARVPGAPTLPDVDVVALQMMQLAAAGQQRSTPVPVPVPPGVPGVPGGLSPFHAPLSFDGIGLLGALTSVPLLDTPAPAPAPAPAQKELRVDQFQHEPQQSAQHAAFDPQVVRAQFPILRERVNGKPLVWLDNAATTQKPQVVIDRLSYFYEHENSNIHRAAHTLAARATTAYEGARESVKRFINAGTTRDIVFVRGATEGINLVAKSWGQRHVKEGDEIVITWLEHHANIVPWQQLCSFSGAKLKVAPVDSTGQIILEEYEKLLGPKTRIVAIPQVSNALGTITPAREMVAMAHRHGAKVLVDGAQAVSHMPVDVQALDCDFYVFSGHKVFAPTGIGVVYGKNELLDETPPWQGGGNMIQDVTFERTVYQPAPARFEAGTGNIADAVGLGAALDWLSDIGLENVERYEHELLVYGTERLLSVPGLHLIGTAKEKAGVLSFILDGQKTEELSGILDRDGIAVRSGHHCAQPILRRFGVEATVRASLAPYNTVDDIDALCVALHRLQAGRPHEVKNVDVKEAEALLKDGSVELIDVREPREWAAGHLPGARHVPLDLIKADVKAHVTRDKVLFVCAKGGRSATAATLAEGLGFSEIYSLDGGTSAWQAAGLPIEVPPPPPTRAEAVPAEELSPPEEEIGLDGIVGANLRDLRANRGFTLDVLAKMTGLSRSLLGQIELGRTAPSVSVVWKVARAFDVPFSAMLSAPGKVKTKLLPAANAKRLVSPDGRYSSRALFPFGEQQVEFYELWLAAHAREDAEAHAPGTRENLVVFSGRLELIVGADRYELGKGDAIVFAADVTHSYINPANEDCWMHLVMTYSH